MTQLLDWLWIAPFAVSFAIAIPMLFFDTRHGWRKLRHARDPRCAHCGVLPCCDCWRERL